MFINTASPSKIKTYDTCKLKYKFRYVDRLYDNFNEESDTSHLHFGTYVHKIFEDGWQAESLEELTELAKNIRTEFDFKSPKEKQIPLILSNFFEWNSQLENTVSAEWKFHIEIADGMSLNGIIDRIVKGKTGKYLIIDYKTSKRAVSKRDLYNDEQMLTYVVAVHKEYNVPIKDITVAHYYPHLDKTVNISYLPIHISNFIRKIKDKFWEIRKKKVEDFYPCRGPLCNWCDYKGLCPLFGGTDKMLKEAKEARGDSRNRK